MQHLGRGWLKTYNVFMNYSLCEKKLQQKGLLTNRTPLFRMVEKKLVRVKVTMELRRSEKTAKLPTTTSPITASPIVANFVPVSLALGSIFNIAGALGVVTQKSSQEFPRQHLVIVKRLCETTSNFLKKLCSQEKLC